MKVIVLGTRGFPDVQGGIEAHCQNLYPRLAKLGCEVIVLARVPYVGTKEYEYEGVKIIPLSCPKNKFLEAIIHTFKGIITAKKLQPDLVHFHAIGPSLLIPFARLIGLRAVMTHHGPDYLRKKWNWLGKAILRIGEGNGCRNADKVICVSKAVSLKLESDYKRNVTYIPNGICVKRYANGDDDVLADHGLQKGKYILAVGRFVPEKGFHDLIEAFNLIDVKQLKLVIAGDADHEDRYSLALKRQAALSSRVILTGYLKSDVLNQLYVSAGLFVLPSYYEGLPIALLEAASFGLPCLVSDIPANREVSLDKLRYFSCGNIPELKTKIEEVFLSPFSELDRNAQIQAVKEKFDWDLVANQTFRNLLTSK